MTPFVAQSHTISCWMKSTQTTAGRLITLPTVLLLGGSDQHFSLDINITYSGGVDSSLVGIYIDDVCISGHGHAGVWASSTSSVTDNDWHHVLGVIDSVSHELRIYVDGQFENAFTYPCGPSSYATDNLHFGSYDSTDTTQSYIGVLDDIAIYNRVLTDCEIKQLYYADLVCNIPSVSIADKSILEGKHRNKAIKVSCDTKQTATHNLKHMKNF